MGKVSPISIKYVVRAKLRLSGVVEKPDVIGAIFGQTEGLLGSDLELRELQKNGRIGRIDVNLETRNGKVEGEIFLPSSLDKSETALVAAALETIERIGPCDSEILVTLIEDVRVAKRNFILRRAKELLRKFVEDMPDTQELTKDVSEGVMVESIVSFGADKLPAGKDAETADEIIVVEGRADVINLLRYGFNNVLGLNGSKVADSAVELIKKKIVTVFLDGDRGGDLILKNLKGRAKVNYVARAPDGKEVEELTLKEINLALRARESFEDNPRAFKREEPREERPRRGAVKDEQAGFKLMAEELVGTKGAYLLDAEMEILGKVPLSELTNTLHDVEDVYAVVMDGPAEKDLISIAERKKIKYLIATKFAFKPRGIIALLMKDL